MSTVYPIWHPFTQMKTAGLPLTVVRGKDEFLYLDDGRQIIDCISSWWVTLHGHSNEEIAEAIYKQAKTLEQVIFAGFTHEPAKELARSLLNLLPQNLAHVFFSDNGSTSVEVALKMAFQYWRNKNQEGRTRFIGFDGGYHGDTIGAMSAGGSSSFWKPFGKLMFTIDTVPFPDTWENDPALAEKEESSLNALEQLLRSSDGAFAAVIMEPLVQGAAGMRICRPQFLQRVRELTSQLDVLLIFDEVMTGFGRTGDWFACTKSGISPDILCLSKGISGGFLPLAVTIATSDIYDAFLSDELAKAFFHSHSYTANPIACAAANASVKLLHLGPSLFQDMEQRHRRLAGLHLQGNARLEKFRFCGTIAAFDMTTASSSYYSDHVPKLRQQFLESGLLLRPLGSTIYFMPPLCIRDSTMEQMYGGVAALLAD